MSIYDKYSVDPPKGWERVFEVADAELKLVSEIVDRQSKGKWFPGVEKVFTALELCPLDKVKVVFVGSEVAQDGTSNGMSFSHSRDAPPSTVSEKLFEELQATYSLAKYEEMVRVYLSHRDKMLEEPEKRRTEEEEQFMTMPDAEIKQFVRGFCPVFRRPDHGDLSEWAKQGVLLLNSCLSVNDYQRGSHGQIWNGMITRIVEAIDEVNPRCIYVLPGRQAQETGNKAGQRAIRITTTFPTVKAWGNDDTPSFVGSSVFAQVNDELIKQGRDVIDWCRL